MTQVNEHGSSRSTDQVRRGPGCGATDIGESARAPAAGRARIARDRHRAFRYPVRRAGGAGAARRDDPGRAGGAREGAATLDDQGHRRAAGTRAGDQGTPSDRRPAGAADGDGAGSRAGAAVTQAQGGVAGAAAAGAQPAGTGDPAGGGADPAAHQPVLTPPPAAQRAPARRLGGRMFGSLHSRNYRLFATGQVISNTGSWMQRIAQDWLVLELTHGSGAALGITTG